jgi:hypothetical protein
VVKLIWLNVSYLTVICYVINNRCIIAIKYAVRQLDRPRKILAESVKSAKSVKFLKGSRGPGFPMISFMIGHDRQTPSQTLKHLTDLTNSTYLVEIPVERFLLKELDRPRGIFPRSVKLVLLNDKYFAVICYVLNNTCIRLGV